MTTPVAFHFVLPGGEPLADAEIEIQLSTAGFVLDGDGILMPRVVTATTGVDGRATVNLAPSADFYYVTVMDPVSTAGLSYKFLVPETTDGLPVALEDMVVDRDLSDTEAIQLAIWNAKALARTYMLDAKGSKTVAAASATTAVAAATAATGAAAIGARIYPGTYATDPLTRPDGSASQAGDLYVAPGGITKVYSGTFWAATNVDMPTLAAGTGASAIGHGSITVRQKLLESRSVEEFGAVGDNSTNDIAAFVAAMRYSQDVGGCEITYGSNGRVYRIAYNATFPAIVIPSGTMFRRQGGGYLRIDPTLLPASAPAGGSSNWIPSYGEISTGDAYTLMRPGAGYAGGSPKDGFIVDNFDPATACHDIHIINPKLVCTWVGTLASAQRCYGIRMWFCYDSTIQNPVIKGMPHSGLMWSGGSRNGTTGLAVIEECGKGALPGVSRNGYNAVGIMCLNEPAYSTRSHSSGEVIVNENQDEGYMFSNCGHIVIKSVVGRGNRDRLIEGDTSFDTTETAATLGQEIPNDIVIGQVICDGANSSGGVGQLGISVACGNEGRVTIGTARIRNIGGVGAPMSVSFTNGGRVNIGDVVLENVVVPASNHAVYVRADRVDIQDLTLIDCTGTSNSAIVAIQDADVAYVRGIDADAGFIYGVRFDGTRPARKLSVRDCSPRGLAQAFIYMNLAARAEVVEVIANDADAINSAATVDRSFISVGNASFRCGTLLVEDNRCRVAGVTTQPLTIVGTVTLPVGAIDRARFRRNDFDDEGMFCLAATQNPRCFNNSSGEITDLVDVGNFMPSQRIRQATAAPTTGTWGKGDTVQMQFPDPAGVSLYRCTTPGTFAALVGITGSTVAGQSTATLNDASLVVPGSWISIAGVTGNAGAVTYFRVVSKAGNVVRFSVPLDQTVAGAAVGNLAPVFKALTLAA